LVGEVHAEWLDLDDGEDLIRSDRQGILWDSEFGRALRNWGASLIKEIGRVSKEPRRQRARELFLAKSDFTSRAQARFSDKEVYEVAVELAKQIGSFAAEDELEDEDYVEGLADVILSVAPHKALIAAFQRFNEEIAGGTKASLDHLLALFGKARVAEMASYSQIAAERVRVLHELEGVILVEADEAKLQQMIQEAPWLIEPRWTVITKNQTLKVFKKGFEAFYKKRTKKSIVLAVADEVKRPDFILVSVGERLHIVEIKAPGHKFDDKDMDRLANYIDYFDEFFEDHMEFRTEFPLGYQIDLVVDGINLKKPANKQAFKAARDIGKVKTASWLDFLTKAKKAHELFLDISDKFNAMSKSLTK
jgi:hypothetical protein